MPLRIVQESYPETLREMYLAIDARLAEGRLLLAGERLDAGIYLLGYAAEMSLKLAFCRLDPNIPMDAPVAPALVRMRILWRSLFPATQRDLHDLESLAFLVEYDYGLLHGHGYAPEIQRGLNEMIRLLQGEWWVATRYRSPRAIEIEARKTLGAVEWLLNSHAELWR